MVEIVRVLPQIQRQQWDVTSNDRRVSARGGHNLNGPVLERHPQPAVTKQGRRSVLELADERLVVAKVRVDAVGDQPASRPAACGLHRLPEEVVIPDLSGALINHLTARCASSSPKQLLKR